MATLRLTHRVTPAQAEAVTGLEWAGNETGNTHRPLRWLTPFAQYPATYIFRIFPKGPKSGADNPAYWTTFFWGNYGSFVGGGRYYGAHPYPFDGPTFSTGQNWEISTAFQDWHEGADNEATTGSNGGASATWNRWYTQVFRAYSPSANVFRHEFIYDWDLFVSSSGTQGWFAHEMTDPTWLGQTPATPCIVVGSAPPNDANTASWGDYPGREEFKGIIRGMQFYDAVVGSSASPTIANTADIASELATPGSVRTPWYLKLNPTPSDVADDSGSGHDPSFPVSAPALWTA